MGFWSWANGLGLDWIMGYVSEGAESIKGVLHGLNRSGGGACGRWEHALYVALVGSIHQSQKTTKFGHYSESTITV